ncbi:MAG: MogA/MoaB family molybdenum cofactor biosynthesis protein [Chloroflexota bacterium]
MRFGVLTISDRSFRGERPDLSGPVLINLITLSGNLVEKNAIVPDELELIQNKLVEWADSGILDVILTTGGTGFAPRDIAPEATRSILDRFTPGLDEAMRFNSLKIHTHAMLSRAISGIRKKTLIINLPGSPKAATENFQFISPVLEHAINLLQDDPLAEKGH